MPLELRTVGGATIELPNLDDTVNVRQILNALVDDLSYNPGVSLMFGGKILKADQTIGHFPHGGIMVVGKVVAGQPKRVAASASLPRAAPTTITLHINIPAAQREITITLSSDASIGDMAKAAKEKFPLLVDAKYVHAGNYLANSNGLLKAFGVNDGAHLLAAVGPTADPKALQVMQVRESHTKLRVAVEGQSVTLQMRKGFHEECMRLLFKLDEIKDVSEALRAERKALAKEIQSTQDLLEVDM
jgi:hypothetical protein